MRWSVCCGFGRLAGYEDVNDAERLRHDPAIRWIVGGTAAHSNAASPSQMGRFETQWLAAPANLCALADLSGQWIELRPRTTFEDALYSAALLKPKPSERWLLVTVALQMPRAVGCFRAAGFQVQPYQLGDPPHLFAPYRVGSEALIYLDFVAKEWIDLIAYRLMGRTDALFPGP
jgi:DUF218 domain/Transposase DDE domain group 1